MNKKEMDSGEIERIMIVEMERELEREREKERENERDRVRAAQIKGQKELQLLEQRIRDGAQRSAVQSTYSSTDKAGTSKGDRGLQQLEELNRERVSEYSVLASRYNEDDEKDTILDAERNRGDCNFIYYHYYYYYHVTSLLMPIHFFYLLLVFYPSALLLQLVCFQFHSENYPLLLRHILSIIFSAFCMIHLFDIIPQ